MSELIFLDSFEHYSTDQMGRKWTSTGVLAGVGAGGRTGQGLGFFVFGPSKTFKHEYATMTVGFAYQASGLGNAPIILSNALTGLTASLLHVGDGRFRFTAFGATPVNVSTFVMNVGEWYYIEFKVNIVLTGAIGDAGSVTYTMEARVNEEVILSEVVASTITDVSPMLFAHPKWSAISLGGPGGGHTAGFDDLYVTDDEYLGDIRVAVLYPNAVGDSSMWTPSGGGDNYTKVKEHIADDNATTVSAANVDDVDLYQLDNIDGGFTGVIRGVQALWLLKKSDMGLAAVKGEMKSADAVHDQADEFFPSALDYLYDIEPLRKSPFTSADWSISEINGMQLGIKRTR